MGYCADATIDVLIPADKVQGALKALRDLMTQVDELGSGGSSSGEVWFSWVGTDEVLAALDENNLVKAFKEWRYEAETEDKADLEKLAAPEQPIFEDVRLLYFDGEKYGDDEKLWEALAPFVESGGSIEWRGEDDAHWRFLFEDGGMIEQYGEIVWR
jgi:hypothetical protein